MMRNGLTSTKVCRLSFMNRRACSLFIRTATAKSIRLYQMMNGLKSVTILFKTVSRAT